MVELDDFRDFLEAFLELLYLQSMISVGARSFCEKQPNLLKMITQFDNRRCFEHSLLVDNKLTVAQRVDITLDQKEVRAALDR